MARPSKYKKEYCKKIVKFFSRKPYEDREVNYYNKDGNIFKTDYQRVANDIPFFSEFARKIRVCHDTLLEWTKRYQEFSEAYSVSKALQKEFLVLNGLHGLYNPMFAKFTAQNITDMRDEKNLNIEGEIVDKKIGVIVIPEMLQLEEGADLKALIEGGENDSPSQEKH